MDELVSMLEHLTDFQKENYKVVLIREDNLSFEWAAFVCKTNVFVDSGCSCNVNNMSLADVLNTIISYGMKVEVESECFNELWDFDLGKISEEEWVYE